MCLDDTFCSIYAMLIQACRAVKFLFSSICHFHILTKYLVGR